MRLAGEKLNLEGHTTGAVKQSLIYGPGDIEGHLGKAQFSLIFVLILCFKGWTLLHFGLWKVNASRRPKHMWKS
jgi:hypothetical protein